jgi:hypothetical protein
VEKIIKGRYLPDGKAEYLIHWKGYSKDERTWEPEENLNKFFLDDLKQNPVPMTGMKNKK